MLRINGKVEGGIFVHIKRMGFSEAERESKN